MRTKSSFCIASSAFSPNLIIIFVYWLYISSFHYFKLSFYYSRSFISFSNCDSLFVLSIVCSSNSEYLLVASVSYSEVISFLYSNYDNWSWRSRFSIFYLSFISFNSKIVLFWSSSFYFKFSISSFNSSIIGFLSCSEIWSNERSARALISSSISLISFFSLSSSDSFYISSFT